MVSIIIPVYNVENYIDRCIESVISQTYSNIDIILIDDGSLDASYEKCLMWMRKDKRIRLFAKHNEGLGKTRNFGLLHARGKYIMYVDSDDWVDKRIVEKLINAIRKTGADIAVCDRYNYLNKTNQYELIRNDLAETEIIVDEYKQIIVDVSCVAWGKIYKKSLIIDHKIEQPSCEFEDVITPITIALARKICYVKEPLYYYWADRKGSITNNIQFMSNIDYLEVFVEEFKNRKIYKKFKKQIHDIISYRISWNLKRASDIINREKARLSDLLIKYKEKNNDFLRRHEITCTPRIIQSVCVIGSYNLMIIGKMLLSNSSFDKLRYHYSFSNLVSLMSNPIVELLDKKIIGINEYRCEHVIRDISKEFKYMHCDKLEESNVILIDFLEDRFPIGMLEDKYFTLSDALLESSIHKKIKYKEITFDQRDYDVLWKKSCDELIRLLKERYNNKKVILVKMKLTSIYKKNKENVKFSESYRISQINNRLEKEYEYFIKKYQDVVIINVEDSEIFYTDEEYRHGCYPWHLNVDMYKEIKKRIEEGLYR